MNSYRQSGGRRKPWRGLTSCGNAIQVSTGQSSYPSLKALPGWHQHVTCATYLLQVIKQWHIRLWGNPPLLLDHIGSSSISVLDQHCQRQARDDKAPNDFDSWDRFADLDKRVSPYLDWLPKWDVGSTDSDRCDFNARACTSRIHCSIHNQRGFKRVLHSPPIYMPLQCSAACPKENCLPQWYCLRVTMACR